MDETVVVVGGGQAGAEMVMQLRQNDFAGRLVLLGEEAERPYMRPPLSKSFLAGEVDSKSLALRTAIAYENARIEVRTGERVVQIDRYERKLALASGEVLSYEKLVLSTGGRPRKMKVPGADLADIFYLRTIGDVQALRAAFLPGRRLVIVGGGYIGLEVAAAAVKQGLDVTVLEGAQRVLARVTSPEMSEFYERIHAAQGVKIRTGVAVSGFLPASPESDTVASVECGEGRVLPADLVIVGIGLIPNTELAETAGLIVDNGIVVNSLEQTSDPHIYAIGDCAVHAHHEFLQRSVRLESVPNAIEQARIASAAICGKALPAVTPPWFWSDQYNLKLKMVGLSEGYDILVIRGDLGSESFSTFYLKNDEVIAADTVNRAGEFMIAKRLVAERMSLTPEILRDESIPLKSLLSSAATHAA